MAQLIKKPRLTREEAVFTIINFIQENEITYVDKSWVCEGERRVHWAANGKPMAAKLTTRPFPGGDGWIQLDIEVLGYARKFTFTQALTRTNSI